MKKVKTNLRRNFLFAGIFIINLLLSCNPMQTPLVPEPGVVSYSFRNQFSDNVEETLDMIRNMGITNIEFSNLFGKSATEMRALLDERDMICTSYGVRYNDLTQNIEKVITEAIILGAKYIRVASIPYDDEFQIEDAKRAVYDFNQFGEIISNHGLIFCYHTHGFEFRPYKMGTIFDYMVQNTNPGRVSFEIDIFWVTHAGVDPVKLLNKYPDRFKLMHLKDLKKGVVGDFSGRTSIENDVILGTGQIDIPRVLKAASNTQIEFYYIEDEHPDVVTRIPQSRDFILNITK